MDLEKIKYSKCPNCKSMGLVQIEEFIIIIPVWKFVNIVEKI